MEGFYYVLSVTSCWQCCIILLTNWNHPHHYLLPPPSPTPPENLAEIAATLRGPRGLPGVGRKGPAGEPGEMGPQGLTFQVTTLTLTYYILSAVLFFFLASLWAVYEPPGVLLYVMQALLYYDDYYFLKIFQHHYFFFCVIADITHYTRCPNPTSWLTDPCFLFLNPEQLSLLWRQLLTPSFTGALLTGQLVTIIILLFREWRHLGEVLL